MRRADTDSAVNREMCEIGASNVFIMSTLLARLLFCGEDQSTALYDVLMCLMYLQKVKTRLTLGKLPYRALKHLNRCTCAYL